MKLTKKAAVKLFDHTHITYLLQARNQGGAERRNPPKKIFAPWKNMLGTIQKIWPRLRNLFAPPGVPSWLQAWLIEYLTGLV